MNQLIMTSAVYEGVTAEPHFPTTIDFEGCHLEFEDIYFNRPQEIAERFLQLANSRKGFVECDGGSRFGLSVKTDVHGGVTISFRASPLTFTGKLFIEGSFVFDGEHAEPELWKFCELFSKGVKLVIRQERLSW